MIGKSLSKALCLYAEHALYREDGKWYHNLKKFPGILFDFHGYVVFETQEIYLSNPALKIRKDLNVINGIATLANYIKFSTEECALVFQIIKKNLAESSDPEDTVRASREIDIILRKKNLVKRLKELYNNTCQLCTTQLTLRVGASYSEVHHIRALGKPHEGMDRIDNMICVCPNCHVLLDLKAFTLKAHMLKISKHIINEESIDYHNSLVHS